MDTISLQPFQSDASFEGVFDEPVFGLLASPVLLYQSLLQELNGFGASLSSLKFESTTLSDANVSCSLVSISTLARVRLDRLQVSFFRLHEVGEVTARQVLLGSIGAIQRTQPFVTYSRYDLSVNISAKIVGSTYSALIGRFVTTPADLGKSADAGVAFYLGPDDATGRISGGVVLDRLIARSDGDLIFKANASFEASKVPAERIVDRFDEFVTGALKALGMTMSREAVVAV
jgi:hypothetical protein